MKHGQRSLMVKECGCCGEPFTRKDFALARSMETLRPASWKKAHVFKMDWQGEPWVVKDFQRSSWLFRRVVGRVLISREVRALRALRGLEGTPSGGFRIDSCALAYRFVPGESMRQLKRKGVTLDGGFFPQLEALVKEMHARRVLHLDLRNAWNILATPDLRPFVVDFQSSVSTRFLPAWLRRRLEGIDLSGTYKWWIRLSPSTFDAARAERLRKLHLARRFWPFRRFVLVPSLRSKRRLEPRIRPEARRPVPRKEDHKTLNSETS